MTFKSRQAEREYYDNRAENARVARWLLERGEIDKAWDAVKNDVIKGVTKEKWLDYNGK